MTCGLILSAIFFLLNSSGLRAAFWISHSCTMKACPSGNATCRCWLWNHNLKIQILIICWKKARFCHCNSQALHSYQGLVTHSGRLSVPLRKHIANVCSDRVRIYFKKAWPHSCSPPVPRSQIFAHQQILRKLLYIYISTVSLWRR